MPISTFVLRSHLVLAMAVASTLATGCSVGTEGDTQEAEGQTTEAAMASGTSKSLTYNDGKVSTVYLGRYQVRYTVLATGETGIQTLTPDCMVSPSPFCERFPKTCKFYYDQLFAWFV